MSTNIDLQNYEKRIGVIAKKMEPLGIEIFSLPQNYESRQVLELPEKQSSGKFALLSKELAKDIGRKFKKNGIRRVQYHYPWQKTLLDMDGHDITLTLQFCNIIYEEADAEEMTINYHNVLKYPAPSRIKDMSGKVRKEILGMLEIQANMASHIATHLDSPPTLIVENNPAVSIDKDEKTGEDLLDNMDLVAEDFIDRKGVGGTNLDYSHAWTVVGYFQGEKTYPNLEWCKRQYGGIPESGKSMENFVRKVAPQVDWIHLSDEADPYKHQGLHVGDGNVDFEECAELLDRFLKKEVVATIEVADGHTVPVFKKILEHDFPVLKEIFD